VLAHPENTPNARENREIREPEMVPETSAENGRKYAGNSPGMAANGCMISYNVTEGDRPDGIKIRFKIRIATGKRAREIDARQAKVIMEVLQWQRQHRTRP
jgi:hypothetical protein